MARTLLLYPLLLGSILMLGGCGYFGDRAQRPAWRDAHESACLKQRRVQVTRFVTPRPAIDGPGICGLNQPFYVTALANGAVRIKSRAVLGCPMIAALDSWVSNVVQPAAQVRFGQPVTEIDTMGSYGCRRRNHRRSAPLSEHSFGNALDIGAFTIADGRKLKVVKHWRRGQLQEQAFLREIHAGACKTFRTVLGPGSDRLHENHFHLDLAMHGRTSRGLRHYCRPVIKDILPPPRKDNLPDPPYIEPEPEIARRMIPSRAISVARMQGRFPLGRLQSGRLEPMQGVGRLRAPQPLAARLPIDDRTYGRLRRLEPGAPQQLVPLPQQYIQGNAHIRPDGVFVPPAALRPDALR